MRLDRIIILLHCQNIDIAFPGIGTSLLQYMVHAGTNRAEQIIEAILS